MPHQPRARDSAGKTSIVVAGLCLTLANAVFAQTPDGVRALELQRNQQQNETVLRNQQFMHNAQNPPANPRDAQERTLLDQDQRIRQQQLQQQQRLDLSVQGAGSGPNAEARRASRAQQFERDSQQQQNTFGAERTLQDATRH